MEELMNCEVPVARERSRSPKDKHVSVDTYQVFEDLVDCQTSGGGTDPIEFDKFFDFGVPLKEQTSVMVCLGDQHPDTTSPSRE
ncbi:unnamed protein product [Eruca vesicaria subsp. sativa]|uniref:Uncharacterized protein n=1 Tax=Eruca vesicaria subsp. sativa TaxID=29727 RepID=A0ABC8M8E0_ERUVS|nr:unnamed protein product [Eruca vesicaria subsp. sativa]